MLSRTNYFIIGLCFPIYVALWIRIKKATIANSRQGYQIAKNRFYSFFWLVQRTKQIFKSLCTFVFISSLIWLTPSLTLTLLPFFGVDHRTSTYIYRLSRSVYHFATTLMIIALYALRQAIFGCAKEFLTKYEKGVIKNCCTIPYSPIPHPSPLYPTNNLDKEKCRFREYPATPDTGA